MTFVILLVWVVLSVVIFCLFFNSLESYPIEQTNEETGETETYDEYFITFKSFYQILILVAWTAFCFWLLARHHYMYVPVY